MEKLFISQAVIVEGKYDKIRLEALVDALILPTDGFRIFKDKEMRALIRRLAHSCGILILTDPDGAGFKIRDQVARAAAGGAVYQAYVPDILGKERRKAKPGREGKLGVEGMDTAPLLRALEQAGILEGAPRREEAAISRQDLYDLGLTGGPDAAALRRRVLVALELPARLSTAQMLPVLRRVTTPEALCRIVEQERRMLHGDALSQLSGEL